MSIGNYPRTNGKYLGIFGKQLSPVSHMGTKREEDLAFGTPASSTRRSPQGGRGTDSGDCLQRCSTPSDRACLSPHSFGPSPRRYSFGSSPSGTKVDSGSREDRAHSVGHRPFRSREDSEELSDVSSGATSEESTPTSQHHLKTGRKGENGDWSSPMLTGFLEGHVTRLATPPDGHHSVKGGPCSDVNVISRHHRPRPPPVPRPRTLEGSELIPRHSRVYSPSYHHSRDSSIERGGRESSCERSAHRHHLRPHHTHHHLNHTARRSPSHLCWCEDEAEYDSCDERHHNHRHSYHEGLHHAHLLGSHISHSRERRSRNRRSTSPCYCHLCLPLSPLREPCERGLMALPYSGTKNVEERLSQLEGDKESLQLQVSVLSEQVEAQTEKIHDLEALLEQKRNLLLKTEEQLQKEVITRSSLETIRLELLSEISNLKLRQAATERENLDLRDKIRLAEISAETNRSQTFSPAAASTPLHSFHNNESLSDFRQTPPSSSRRKIEQFGTLPRPQRDLLLGNMPSPLGGHMTSTTGRGAKGVVFGKGLNGALVSLKGMGVVSGKRSTSAPNLAETEKQPASVEPMMTHSKESKQDPVRGTSSIAPLTSHRSPSISHKTSGIKKIFTKLRRSSSGHLENEASEGDLKRGGHRATATARLGWTSQSGLFKEPPIPFSSWSAKHIEEWLGNLGLSQYSAAAKCWMQQSGNHISKATHHQLEKDIGVRHPLHRKKLQLAISNRMTENNAMNKSCAKLDSAWVLRWLDDLGLPQYKDVFSEARIDGLVLNYLTYDDLAFLRIANLMHVSSLKRGILVLRVYNFEPSVLKRRSNPEEETQPPTPLEVSLWTNHRVMEWLKTVDLSEYAPNLRGSGVHGALMVYEVRFTSEFLASLLSIPTQKSLLRRHLCTHFNDLVGKEVVQAKRELQATQGYIPLTTTAKIKMPRKSQFSLKRRKTKTELEFDDLICPLDEMPPKISPQPLNANRERSQRLSAPDTFGRMTKV